MTARSGADASGAARPVVRLVRAASFSSAHRYCNPSLSDEENRRMYGSLYREKGFGHNFRVEAHFEGSVDPLTGMVINLVDIDRWLKAATDELDHRHLNTLPAFQGVAPTPERIALYLYREVSRLMSRDGVTSARLAKMRVYEGDQLWVDYME